MKRFFQLILLLTLPLSLIAFDDQPSCFVDLQSNFFRPDLVMEALSYHSVHEIYQSQWTIVAQKLRDRSRDVPRLMRERSDFLELNQLRNPLQYPFDPVGADKLLRPILLEILSNVLKESNLYNVSAIQDIFAYIYNRQIDLIRACYRVNVPMIGEEQG